MQSLVEATGFEPATPSTPRKCSTKLSHASLFQLPLLPLSLFEVRASSSNKESG